MTSYLQGVSVKMFFFGGEMIYQVYSDFGVVALGSNHDSVMIRVLVGILSITMLGN